MGNRPVRVAARSKAYVCGRSSAEIVGSNPTGGTEVCCKCCVLSGRGLCDELITRPEESYQVWCVWVWSRKLREWGCHGPLRAVAPKIKIKKIGKTELLKSRTCFVHHKSQTYCHDAQHRRGFLSFCQTRLTLQWKLLTVRQVFYT